MSEHVDVRDLLGLRFVAGLTDCAALSREVLRRAGRSDSALVLDDNPNTIEDLAARIEGGELPKWETVGSDVSAATQVCDIIVGPVGGALHIAIITSERPRLALTAVRGSYSRQIHPEWFKDCTLVLRPTTVPV